MKIDDLRTLLEEHADEAGPVGIAPHVEVRARIRRRARARTAGAVVAAVAVVAAGALVVPSLTNDRQPVAPASSPVPIAVVTPLVAPTDPAGFGSFADAVDGDRLLRGYVVARGETSGTFTVTAAGAGLRYYVQCVVPKGSTTVAVNDLLLQLTENGTTIGSMGCGTDLATVPSVFGSARSGTATISIRLEDHGNLVADPAARLAVGVYERTGKTVTKAGVTVPVVKGSSPDATTLRSFDILTLSSTKRKLTVRMPTSTKPLTVTYRVSGAASTGLTHLGVGGTDVSAIQGAGIYTMTVPAGPARDATVTVDDKKGAGKLALAIYAAP